MEPSVAKSAYKDLPPTGFWRESGTPHSTSATTLDPLLITLAAHGKQAQLGVEEALHEAREALRAASELVANRGMAMKDAYLRHHLLSLAREISALSMSVKAQPCQTELGPPSFASILDEEIAYVGAMFPHRQGQIRRTAVTIDFFPSWTATHIFGLIARTLVRDAIWNTEPDARLFVRLRQDRAMLRFRIDGVGGCTEPELMSRIAHPRRFLALVCSLSGRIESAPNGITIRMPIIACSRLDPLDIRSV
jgi:hypothetical protein